MWEGLSEGGVCPPRVALLGRLLGSCSNDGAVRIISANFHRGGRLLAGFGIWLQVWGVWLHPCADLKSG